MLLYNILKKSVQAIAVACFAIYIERENWPKIDWPEWPRIDWSKIGPLKSQGSDWSERVPPKRSTPSIFYFSQILYEMVKITGVAFISFSWGYLHNIPSFNRFSCRFS